MGRTSEIRHKRRRRRIRTGTLEAEAAMNHRARERRRQRYVPPVRTVAVSIVGTWISSGLYWEDADGNYNSRDTLSCGCGCGAKRPAGSPPTRKSPGTGWRGPYTWFCGGCGAHNVDDALSCNCGEQRPPGRPHRMMM